MELDSSPNFLASFLRPYSNWIYENQTAALALAVFVPLAVVMFNSALSKRKRLRQLEEEDSRSGQRSHLSNETLERNQREEDRYRKSHKVKPEGPRRGGSGPRFK